MNKINWQEELSNSIKENKNINWEAEIIKKAKKKDNRLVIALNLLNESAAVFDELELNKYSETITKIIEKLA